MILRQRNKDYVEVSEKFQRGWLMRGRNDPKRPRHPLMAGLTFSCARQKP